MSYIVLARKYRPKNFSEMVGQEHVVQALGNALTTQRLHHAYLFTGTRGVGKTTVSRILAKSLNCVGPDGRGTITATPCGLCPACTDIDSGRFVDYTELDAASNRGVEDVQALLEQAVYKPVQGRFKVFMIDEVHMLSGTAFNAMLKTLEEPPEYLKFVLATTDPQKVPVTVLSRCLQFNLRPMAPDTVFEHLNTVLNAEQVATEPMALRLLARAARGSMRDALSLCDQAIAFGGGQLLEAPVRQMLGAVDRSHVVALIRSLAAGDGAATVNTVDALRRQGLSAASTLEEMTHVLQRMAVLQLAQVSPDATDPDAADLADLAQALPPDQTQLLYSLCLHGRAELGLAPDEYAALVMVLLRLLAFQPGSYVAEKKSLNTEGGRARSPAPVAPAVSRVAAAAAVGGAPARPVPPAVEPIAPRPVPVPVPVPEPDPAPASVPVPVPVPVPVSEAAHEPEQMPRPAPTPGPEQAPASAEVPLSAPVARMANQGAVAEAEAAAVPPWEDEPAAPTVTPAQMPAALLVGLPSINLKEKQPLSHDEKEKYALDCDGPGGAEQTVSHVPQAMASPQGPALELSDVGDFWHALVTAMAKAESIGALVRELALQSQLVARDDHRNPPHWLLRVETTSLNQAGVRDRLKAALAEHGHSVQIGVEVGAITDSPARRNAAAAAVRQREAEGSMLQDPFVQAMMRDFGGKIVPGTLKPR